MNCVKVTPFWSNTFDNDTLLPTGEREIHAYQFVFINDDAIHTAEISVQDIKEGKAVKLGTYDFMYLLFENETTSYQVDRAFFENVFKRFENYYILPAA